MEGNRFSDEEEISLKELLLSLWNGRKLIALITSVFIIASAGYTFFIANARYEATSELIISIPESLETRYGTYKYPSENISDYTQFIKSSDVIDRVIKQMKLARTRDSIRNAISVEQGKEQNSFKIVVSGSDPELAKALNDTIMSQYIANLRIAYKRSAIDGFHQTISIEIDNLTNAIELNKSTIEKMKALLDEVQSIYTLQKSIFDDPKTAAKYADTFNLNLSKLSDDVMVEEFANENYFLVEQQLLDARVQLLKDEQTLENRQMLVKELDQEIKFYNEHYGTADELKILNGRADVFASNISIVSKAYLPENPVSPRKMLNLAIGLVLGLMCGVFAALFQAYWKSN